MSNKRAVCSDCQRPLARCMCRYIVPTANHCRVLLLQHPKENGHPKNTGELLWRSLQHCELKVAEQFSLSELSPWLPGATLLYPTEKSDKPAYSDGLSQSHAPDKLIVIDATWRKSLKMLHLNPALLDLPRIQLADHLCGNYRVRTAKKHHQLSTLEASCYALQQIESNQSLYEPLLEQFDHYMTHLANFDPNR
ncbi:tRNA-uridine aminocarboxypropyltransferase [Gilvimarinus sp. SDUM040013]|uniref:tRNA-uridine aminocarboxypropyltransferase n=1 Tax=Gilvimarinus gilvus TaxID=3058038 RepID=A0ABU4RWX9_9GAMM|nr:tRNA-uridine aminocarboxypropyltransferase [Gilvimarinus sp. SDUM040013]MDO3385747.1 tRNA-uridine aminocarboxypropyltransferase [Gilvimarinus sp. SDUM040013]MDX6849387.1 tRNA-uridine aminocarboxypropyltransferase [Gilvimarinus sp. SDUM040013]